MARGTKGKMAERLFRKWLISEGWDRGAIAHAIATKWQRQDILACDVVAFRDGSLWFVQITTVKAKPARRRRVEAIGWNPGEWNENALDDSLKVSIVTQETIPDPANRIKKMHYWRVEDYTGNGIWGPAYVIGPFDKKAVEKIKFKEK